MMMKRLRVVILSLLIMVLIAGGLPVVSTLAKWSRRAAAENGGKHGHYRKHTRAWWRRQRARQRARRARALAHRQRLEALRAQTPLHALASTASPLSNAALSSPAAVDAAHARINARENAPATAPAPRMPFEYATPQAWGVARRSAAGTVQFTLRTPAGKPAGIATLAPVNLPRDAAPSPSLSKKAVGGVSVATLRRTVIDRMVAEGGWVTNDYVREIGGRPVFVVLAQSGAPGAPTQSHTFYFTEVDGHVYSLAANTPVELAEPVAAGSEQLMSSLRSSGQNNLVRQK